MYNKTATMPVVSIRDPYQWMQSMCENQYSVVSPHWPKYCPNLVAKGKPIPVNIMYSLKDIVEFPSLAHIWSEYYSQYGRADYPRLIVRYEDIIFHPRQVIEEVCECVGGELSAPFSFIAENPKHGSQGHGDQKKNGLMASIMKLGNFSRRVKGLTAEDLSYSNIALDSDLMQQFHYTRPDTSIAT